LILLVLAWMALSVTLVHRTVTSGHWPLSNQYESLMFLVWGVSTVYGIVLAAWFKSTEGLAPWVAAFTLLGLGAASLLDSTVEPLVPALQSNWLLIHVATTMLGYAAFTLGFVGAVAFLVKTANPGNPFDGTSLDLFLYRSGALGFCLLTLGIATGAVWANSAWGSYWSWDPKETWALITWLTYAGALHLRRMRNWRGRPFAWLMVGGFAVVLFTYFGVNYLLSGLHSYA
jgi:ABC-type transport system involved in cytochrome c biogenesis permease subunit